MLSNTLYSTFLLFRLSFLVSTSPTTNIEEDVTSSITPIDNLSSPATTTTTTTFPLEKRDGLSNVLPLTSCAAPFRFSSSNCIRTRNNRDFVINCYTNSQMTHGYMPRGSCPEDYLCVDGARIRTVMWKNPRNTAYCVSTDNFVKVTQKIMASDPASPVSSSTTTTDPQSIEVTAQYTAPKSPHTGAFQAILTDLDGINGKPVNATSLSIDAQVSHVLAGVTSWRSVLPGGSKKTCNDCVSVGIQDVPPATQRIDVKVTLEAGVSSALLYLVPVSS